MTMKEVAAAVGVSVESVSNAYNRPEKLSKDVRARILSTVPSSVTTDERGRPGAAARPADAVGIVYANSSPTPSGTRNPATRLGAVADVLEENCISINLLPIPSQSPSDHGVGHPRRVCRAVVGDRQQVDADAVLLEHVRHGTEQGDGVRVPEGVGELFGVDDADRVGTTVPKSPAGRARSVVTERGAGAEDARAHVLGQLLGTVVGVRDGGDRDPDGRGHFLHRHARHGPHPRYAPPSSDRSRADG